MLYTPLAYKLLLMLDTSILSLSLVAIIPTKKCIGPAAGRKDNVPEVNVVYEFGGLKENVYVSIPIVVLDYVFGTLSIIIAANSKSFKIPSNNKPIEY